MIFRKDWFKYTKASRFQQFKLYIFYIIHNCIRRECMNLHKDLKAICAKLTFFAQRTWRSFSGKSNFYQCSMRFGYTEKDSVLFLFFIGITPLSLFPEIYRMPFVSIWPKDLSLQFIFYNKRPFQVVVYWIGCAAILDKMTRPSRTRFSGRITAHTFLADMQSIFLTFYMIY